MRALTPAAAALIFGVFAFVYFFSALLRAVTATLAPVFSAELGLRAADLGLLAGAYFLGFAALQLPLGHALDRHGPRRTLVALLALAVLGCAAFALAPNLAGLIAARMLIGAGVAACLMAPLTCYRRLFDANAQLRANSWMLMTGSLGMLASTVPVQLLLPSLGWRGLFWLLAAMLLLGLMLVAWLAPRDEAAPRTAAAIVPATSKNPAASAAVSIADEAGSPLDSDAAGYAQIVRHPLFVATAPLAFFVYGGLIAVQALWAGPWLTRVGGFSADAAARGLFVVNLSMLLAFATWGAVMPRLAQWGITPWALMRWGLPLALVLLFVNVALGAAAGPWAWAAWCVACTFVSVSQPAVGAAFPAEQAGRALSAYNLVIFGGVFCIQWGVGLAIDALRAAGVAEAQAFRAAFGGFGLACVGAYVWFSCAREAVAPGSANNPRL